GRAGVRQWRTPVSEGDYWLNLEYRVSREFAGMPDNRLRFLWCDGFVPGYYILQDPVPHVMGHAWIGDGGELEDWAFTLFLAKSVDSSDQIDWSALLPGDNMTCWLAVDRARKRIQIDPLAAVPEPA